ncbi:MAG: class I poly(R)-hydroxyalkanoic acid synthase [Rhodospirillales bacterium]|nr:class I poly(R)-hydroxyalkanoic acid synthase [Rhodospirillales bacterium]
MADQPASAASTTTDRNLAADLAAVMGRAGRVFVTMAAKQAQEGLDNDPLNARPAFAALGAKMMQDPGRLMDAQIGLWRDYLDLWANSARRMLGAEATNTIEPDKADRRFKDAAWTENEVFNVIKQSYLLTARAIQAAVADVEGLEPDQARKAEFYTRQIVAALAPTNFAFTNPEVLRATMDSRGENLIKGLTNLLDDIENGKGRLQIRMTDLKAFKVGGNVATTPGKVVYQNELMQLIQYTPTTPKVHKRPLLVVTPWINKFYILDLSEKNSYIRWAVAQGHTVFVISWVNPNAALAKKSFEDYMLEGPLAAIDAITKATGEPDVNAVGYCIGGTLLATTLAYMASKKDERIVSATFFTTMIDFTDSGDLGVFIDEPQLASLEQKMNEAGFLDGADMATTFNMLRANDLIWTFVINNYLLGKEPFPFDLLYWNADSTRMPAAMHSFYLRKMYLENKLIVPNALTVAGVPIDLRKIKIPAYVLATKDDHIAPWKSTYAATRTYTGPVNFVLAASGHIAGVINPPETNKYSHWINPKNPPNPDDWLAGATEHTGSWWPDWAKWLAKNAGKNDVEALVPGKGGLKVIEDAPGSYVRGRAD